MTSINLTTPVLAEFIDYSLWLASLPPYKIDNDDLKDLQRKALNIKQIIQETGICP